MVVKKQARSPGQLKCGFYPQREATSGFEGGGIACAFLQGPSGRVGGGQWAQEGPMALERWVGAMTIVRGRDGVPGWARLGFLNLSTADVLPCITCLSGVVLGTEPSLQALPTGGQRRPLPPCPPSCDYSRQMPPAT